MDKEQLLAWLDAQIRTHGEETGRAMAVWVAHRAAARVLPFAWDEFTFSEWPRQFAVTALPILLLHIMSRIDRQKATFSASKSDAGSAVLSASDTAADAGANGAPVLAARVAVTVGKLPLLSIANIVSGTQNDVFGSGGRLLSTIVAEDVERVQRDVAVLDADVPLWPDDDNPFADEWQGLREKLQAEPNAPWAFFIDLYDRALRGDAPDWDILKALAHKDADDAWESSDLSQLNAIIDQTRAARLAEQTPMGSEIRQDAQTGRLYEAQYVDAADTLLQQAAFEIAEAADQIQDMEGNSANLLEPVRRKLHRAVERHAHMAGRLQSIAVRCRGMIVATWQEEALGDPHHDPISKPILEHLDAAIGCLLDHPEVKEIATRKMRNSALIEGEIVDALEEAGTLIANASSESLAMDIRGDLILLKDLSADRVEKEDAAYFTTARTVRVAVGVLTGTIAFPVGLGSYADAGLKLQDFMASPWGARLLELLSRLF